MIYVCCDTEYEENQMLQPQEGKRQTEAKLSPCMQNFLISAKLKVAQTHFLKKLKKNLEIWLHLASLSTTHLDLLHSS